MFIWPEEDGRAHISPNGPVRAVSMKSQHYWDKIDLCLDDPSYDQWETTRAGVCLESSGGLWLRNAISICLIRRLQLLARKRGGSLSFVLSCVSWNGR